MKQIRPHFDSQNDATVRGSPAIDIVDGEPTLGGVHLRPRRRLLPITGVWP